MVTNQEAEEPEAGITFIAWPWFPLCQTGPTSHRFPMFPKQLCLLRTKQCDPTGNTSHQNSNRGARMGLSSSCDPSWKKTGVDAGPPIHSGAGSDSELSQLSKVSAGGRMRLVPAMRSGTACTPASDISISISGSRKSPEM